MGQAKPFRPIALVVEDDPLQSSFASTVLEEAEFNVIECRSAEAALVVLQDRDARIAFVFTDVNLAGTINGLELGAIIRELYPRTAVVITSGDIRDRASEIPTGMQFMQKPWRPLDLLVAAERARA